MACKLAWALGFLGVVGSLGAAEPTAPKKSATTPAPSAETWLARAQDAGSRGLMKQAIEFATHAIEAAPTDPKAYYFRAQLHERTRQFPAAEVDLNRCIELSPAEPALFLTRGLVRLRLMDFNGSVADLDRYVELRPSQAPQLWQRGIALFYAGRYDDGRLQFELHRTVNPNDVENSAWHFACIAQTQGAAKARELWMPCVGDRRVPMKEIQDLMSGTGTPEAVLAAANAVSNEVRKAEAQLYANLYLSLYHGAEGRREPQARHAVDASKYAGGMGIMGDIAQVHANWVEEKLRATK